MAAGSQSPHSIKILRRLVSMERFADCVVQTLYKDGGSRQHTRTLPAHLNHLRGHPPNRGADGSEAQLPGWLTAATHPRIADTAAQHRDPQCSDKSAGRLA